MGVEDGDGAAGGVGEDARGREVSGSAVVLGRRARQNAVPCGEGGLGGRPLHLDGFALPLLQINGVCEYEENEDEVVERDNEVGGERSWMREKEKIRSLQHATARHVGRHR